MPTIEDVSRLSGISVRTVSKVLNGDLTVSSGTREKVLSAVRELNFVPNENARMLRLSSREKERRTPADLRLGCVTFSMFKSTDPYFGAILQGIMEELGDLDNRLQFIYRAEQLEAEPSFISQRIALARTDGVVLLATSLRADVLQELCLRVKNIVSVNLEADPHIDSVLTDLRQGAADAVRYLWSLGHRRIGFIGDPITPDERYCGYRDALAELGAPFDERLVAWDPAPLAYDAGERAAQKMLAAAIPPPTAVFVAYDMLAIGAMRGFTAAGLAVPHDISIIGYDDIAEARLTTPSLTTMRVEKEHMGRTAVRRLVERILNPALPSVKMVLRAQVVERASCRRL